jgi:hypothetical protein
MFGYVVHLTIVGGRIALRIYGFGIWLATLRNVSSGSTVPRDMNQP